MSPGQIRLGSQLTTGQWLPGFPGREMSNMKGKFLQEKKTFLRVFCLISDFIPMVSLLIHGGHFERGGMVEHCHIPTRRAAERPGLGRLGAPGQPSSLPLES